MQDVQDILAVRTAELPSQPEPKLKKRRSKKPPNVSREVYWLTTQAAASTTGTMAPAVAPLTEFKKEKRKIGTTSLGWEWSPFTPSGSRLDLHHWTPKRPPNTAPPGLHLQSTPTILAGVQSRLSQNLTYHQMFQHTPIRSTIRT